MLAELIGGFASVYSHLKNIITSFFWGGSLTEYYTAIKMRGRKSLELLQINGVLLLRKPVGMTSHDCVNKIRKLFHTKKVGHTGTLDPDVEGVLPICIGRATKIATYLTADSKVYEGVIQLGTSTTTEDASGDIVDSLKVNTEFNRKEIEKVFHAFTGEITQKPPMYSAVKVNGKKLYEYARAGVDVERPERTISIHSLELLSDAKLFKDKIPFRVHCSKGTYVRTLAVDIGTRLGYPAHLSYLIRTASGGFTLDHCLSFSDLQNLADSDQLKDAVMPINEALSDMPSYVVDEGLEDRILNGAVIEQPSSFYTQPFTVYNRQGECIAIYQPHPTKTGLIKPVKILKIT